LEAGKAVAERVVLKDALVAVLHLVREGWQHAGVDEDADDGRQFVAGDEVVQDHRDTDAIAERAAAIEKDHEGRGPGGIVLRGHVDAVGMRCAGIELAGRQVVVGDDAFGHAGVRLGIGTEGIGLRVGRGLGSGLRAKKRKSEGKEQEQKHAFHGDLRGDA